MTASNYVVSFASGWLGVVRPPENWFKNKRSPAPPVFFFFFLNEVSDCINTQPVSRWGGWIESHLKAKPRCLVAVENFSFSLHNTLTCVCFILAPRQDVISVATAPHWVADEIKPLAVEICCFVSELFPFYIFVGDLDISLFSHAELNSKAFNWLS